MPNERPNHPLEELNKDGTRPRVRADRVEGQPRRLEDKRVLWRRQLPWLCVLPGAVLVFSLAGLVPETVEHVYSRTLYPAIGQILSTLTGWVPISVAEVLLAFGVLFVLWRAGRAVAKVLNHSRSWGNVLKRGLIHTLRWSGILYAAFLLTWGLNYRRVPLHETLGMTQAMNAEPASVDELESLARELAAEASRLRSEILERDDGVMTLAHGPRSVLHEAARAFVELDPRLEFMEGSYGDPKAVLLGPLFTSLGISGIYCPFTGEPNVNTAVPDVIIPFFTCHEIAHQRGIAAEDEANFVASRACRYHPSVEFRYSGAFQSLRYVVGELARADASRWESLRTDRSVMAPGVVRDLEDIQKWAKDNASGLTRAAKGVNDVYLKAQGTDGVKSYGDVVRYLVAERRMRKARSQS